MSNHPYLEYIQNAVKVTESKAEEAHLPENITGINIEPDADYRVRADIKALNKTLHSIETPKEVKYLSIHYDSKLTHKRKYRTLISWNIFQT